MWKRGGRSSALDRAQALLQGSAAKTWAHTGAVKTRSAPPNTNTFLSDLSDLSSIGSSPEPAADTVGSAADTVGSAAAGKAQEREGGSTKAFRPQSSLAPGGSRFLKKAPPPVNHSSQSPVSKSQMQRVPEPRNVSSSLRGSQTAALNRLAQIESRICSHKQAAPAPKHAENLNSDLGGISPPSTAQSLEASVQLSAQSSSDQSLKGRRFLKNNTAVAVNNSNAAAARSPQGRNVSVRPKSRAADAVVASAGSGTKSVRIVSGVSLESDEEDMRKLLGDSFTSIDNSFSISGRPSSIRTADKMLRKSRQKVHSTPPPAAVPPSSSTAPPRSPTSPSRRSSPFRFTGQAQAHFSPSALSPSPSPPRVSPSPPGRLNYLHRVGSPRRSHSSMSGCSEVLSLEELFPIGPGSEDPHSEMSDVSSEDFKINVMTLDDLVPASLGFIEETQGEEREAKLSAPVPGSPNRQQLPILKEKEEEQQQDEEDVLDYQSDFESESKTETDYSASQVSKHLLGHGDEEEVVSEVREEASDSDVSRGRVEDDYLSTFSEASRSYTSRTSDRSQALSRSRDSRSSVSHGSQSRRLSRQSRRRASTSKVFKEAAVQTQPDPLAYTWPAGMTILGPTVEMTCMDPTRVIGGTLSAERLEALSTFNPAAFALMEVLKQQLAMIRRFIESSRHLHSSLVQSLEPPNYRYTTLEDTEKYIRKHRPPKQTMD